MKDKKNFLLIKSGILLMIMIFFSKLLGLLRETVLASKLGATFEGDIYIYVTGLSTIAFSIIGNTVGTTFVPVLAELIQEKKDSERKRFVNNMITIFSIISILVIIFVLFFAKYILIILAPGFKEQYNSEQFNLAILITKIVFVSFIFNTLQSIIRGVLNTHKDFIITGSVDLVYNIVLILFLIFSYKSYGLIGISVGIVIATLSQFLVQIPKFIRNGYRYKWVLDLKDRNLIKILKMSVPILIGISVSQINMLVDRGLSTFLETGMLSLMNYATKLNLLLYTVIGLAITTVMFTDLSLSTKDKSYKEFNNKLKSAMYLMNFIMIPGTVLLIIFRSEIVKFIYYRGAFTLEDVKITSNIIFLYSIGMIFYGIKDILNRAFYALQDTKTPMINSIIGVVSNIVFNLILIWKIGVYGLAIGTSISSIVTSILLMFKIKKATKLNLKEVSIQNLKILIATAVMSICVYLIKDKIFSNSLVNIIFGCFIGGIIYLGCMLILGDKNKFLKLIRR